MKIARWALGALVLLIAPYVPPRGEARAFTLEFTESSGSGLSYCTVSIVSSGGLILQAERFDTLTSSGGAERSVRIKPKQSAKDGAAAINVSCCDTEGVCSESEQLQVDLIDMMPEEMGELSFDGSTIGYVEPSTFLNDSSPLPNLTKCQFEFVTDAGVVLQVFRQNASSPTGGASRTLAVEVRQRVRDTGAFLDGSCLTDLGVRGVVRRISLQGVFD